MAAYQKIFAYVLALIVVVAAVEAGAITKRRVGYYDSLNELVDKVSHKVP